MIPRDKLLHIGLGVLWLIITMLNLWVFTLFGLGPALAYGTTAFGITKGVARYTGNFTPPAAAFPTS